MAALPGLNNCKAELARERARVAARAEAEAEAAAQARAKALVLARQAELAEADPAAALRLATKEGRLEDVQSSW